MKRFLLKITLFMISLIGVYAFLVNKLSEDYVDIHYKKFTQKAGGLIIGVSKASRGINPAIVEEKLNDLNYDTPIVNFALDVNNSPYGEVYLEAIKKKIKPKERKQLFIISVTPVAFAAPLNMVSEDIFNMDKNHTILGKVSQVDTKPNYNYILNTYEQPLYNALHPYEKWIHSTVHDNGWFEITLISGKDTIADSDIKLWKSKNLEISANKLAMQEVSEYRVESFTKILEFLRTRGDVFIVRIPEDEEFMNLEKEFWPDFEERIDGLAQKHNIPFLNYSNLVNKFKTYDGLHFDTKGTTEFTTMLSADIYDFLKKH